MKRRRKRKRSHNPTGMSAPPYPFEFKLKLVRLYLEDGYGVPMLVQEFGVSEYSLYRWGKLYREYGEAGLLPRGRSKPAQRLSERKRKRGQVYTACCPKPDLIHHAKANRNKRYLIELGLLQGR